MPNLPKAGFLPPFPERWPVHAADVLLWFPYSSSVCGYKELPDLSRI